VKKHLRHLPGRADVGPFLERDLDLVTKEVLDRLLA
jgi:hypothetical protein